MSAELSRPLWLASGSPRRSALLTQVGVPFTVEPSRAEERREPGETPREFAARAASDKAEEVWLRCEASAAGAFVLGADTVVVRGDDVLGKPRDDEDAARMLRALSGEAHEVMTGVSLWSPAGEYGRICCVTRLRFQELSADTIARYVALGEGRDKAGAYAAQGVAAGFLRELEGSYANVVGLPLAECLELLRDAGVLTAWP